MRYVPSLPLFHPVRASQVPAGTAASASAGNASSEFGSTVTRSRKNAFSIIMIMLWWQQLVHFLSHPRLKQLAPATTGCIGHSNDFVDWHQKKGAGWVTHGMDSAKTVIIGCRLLGKTIGIDVVNALWYSECHHDRLGLGQQGTPVPPSFSTFQSNSFVSDMTVALKKTWFSFRMWPFISPSALVSSSNMDLWYIFWHWDCPYNQDYQVGTWPWDIDHSRHFQSCYFIYFLVFQGTEPSRNLTGRSLSTSSALQWTGLLHCFAICVSSEFKVIHRDWRTVAVPY